MGLVKTRRLAAMHPPSPRLPPSLKLPPSPRLRWTRRRTRKQQRAKAAMKPPMKGGARKDDGVFWLRGGCTDKGKVYR